MTLYIDAKLIVSLISAMVASISTYLAYRSHREQRRLKWSMVYSRQINAESMMLQDEALLQLHGISKEMLEDADATVEEVVYLLLSFRMGQESSRLNSQWGKWKLSPYRTQMLNNEKVAKIWRIILYEKLFFRTKFVVAINEYIRKRYGDGFHD